MLYNIYSKSQLLFDTIIYCVKYACLQQFQKSLYPNILNSVKGIQINLKEIFFFIEIFLIWKPQ